MPLPRLIHPVPVQVEALQRSATIVDEDFREPVQQATRGPRVTIQGQVKWGLDEALKMSLSGADQESSGYILFRLADVRAAGLGQLKQNDRFVSIGSGANKVDVDLYVTALRYQGHYGDQGGATLVQAFFKDRFPSKSTRGGK